jgi:hypothetical protein
MCLSPPSDRAGECQIKASYFFRPTPVTARFAGRNVDVLAGMAHVPDEFPRAFAESVRAFASYMHMLADHGHVLADHAHIFPRNTHVFADHTHILGENRRIIYSLKVLII